MNKKLLLLVVVFSLFRLNAAEREKITLHGEWNLFLDAKNQHNLNVNSVVFDDVIQLPASLDEARKGNKAELSNSTHRMLRKYSYYGKAWYSKDIEIPASWKNKEIELTIERSRPSHVWIDGRYVGNNNIISAPQKYRLTEFLPKGTHRICVMVDNGEDCGLPAEIASSHMWSDDTQTNWNGLLGEISITAKNNVFINRFETRPNVDSKSVILDLYIDNFSNKEQEYTILVKSAGREGDNSYQAKSQSFPLSLKKGSGKYQLEFSLGNDASLWSEYSPALYDLSIELQRKGKSFDQIETSIGLREFKIEQKIFKINGKNVFLRGKHDACVFPLTGYAPMNHQDWEDYFQTVNNYGFNHVRFHSWCPPKAAFDVADAMGIYLQVELPYWGPVTNDAEHPVSRFLYAEALAVLHEFANHPSFVLFSTGNEPWGDISGLRALTARFKAEDPRPLYAFGSNYHMGWSGEQEGEDFMVTCRVGGENDEKFEPQVRSSFSFADAIDGGRLNATYPNTEMDFSIGASHTSKPVVSHETGQFQMLPDPKELNLYQGVLYPRNLEIFVERYQEKYGAEKYRRYFDAAAALSLICYKADLEIMRRTHNLAGFQMLDLQDFPGQGTAIVGILNSMMKSKGIISEEEFRTWNSDVMPLWLADRYTHFTTKSIRGKLRVSNNSERNFDEMTVNWSLRSKDFTRQGKVKLHVPAGQLSESVALEIELPDVDKAMACELSFTIENSDYQNKYPLWIYPHLPEIPQTKVSVKTFSRMDDELLSWLQAGGRALLMPDAGAYPEQTLGGMFSSDYWNYSMFKGISERAKKPISPGTMGLLIQKEHPIFHNFPTETHSNWQWWSVVKNSNPLILNNLLGKLQPIVETIDNIERVHFTGLIFECQVGKGRLLVCMSDLKNTLNYNENKQLYASIIDYINSDDFNPTDRIDIEELKALFTLKSNTEYIQGVRNVTYD